MKFRLEIWRLNKYELYKNEKTLLLDGVYSDFEMFDNVAVPSTVVINNKLNNQKITIDYRKISVNENLQNLKLEIPKDVVVKIW